MSDLTTREVSQRLKATRFSAKKSGTWIYDGVEELDNMEWVLDTDERLWSAEMKPIPAYSASTLFEWLRENKYDLSFYFDYEAQLRVDVGLSDDIEFRIEENYSLPDMLAEAIIWILTQEKENK
jgi:hypothetical protein